MALSETKETVYLRKLFKKMYDDKYVTNPTDILCYNQRVIVLSKENMLHQKNKHMIRYHFSIDAQSKGLIDVIFVMIYHTFCN